MARLVVMLVVSVLGFIFIINFAFKHGKAHKAANGLPIVERFEPREVIFIGDSVTAGFGWYRDNTGAPDSLLGLSKCFPPHLLPDDRCSNNSPGIYDRNADSDDLSLVPNVAYAYQFRDMINPIRQQQKKETVKIRNYAVTSSIPAHWDGSEGSKALEYERCLVHKNQEICERPSNYRCVWQKDKCVPDPSWMQSVGAFLKAGHEVNLPEKQYSFETKWGIDSVERKSDAVFVLTLGANPIMDRWLHPSVFLIGELEKGYSFLGYDSRKDHAFCLQSEENAIQCMEEDIAYFRVKQRLRNVYSELLQRGDVLAVQYPIGCPGFMAQTESSFESPIFPGGSPKCSSKEKRIVAAIAKKLNETIREVVDGLRGKSLKYQIATMCAGYGVRSEKHPMGECGVFMEHQFKDKDTWFVTFDSGIHPNKKGHKMLARSVFYGLCEKLGHYCDELQDFK